MCACVCVWGGGGDMGGGTIGNDYNIGENQPPLYSTQWAGIYTWIPENITNEIS